MQNKQLIGKVFQIIGKELTKLNDVELSIHVTPLDGNGLALNWQVYCQEGSDFVEYLRNKFFDKGIYFEYGSSTIDPIVTWYLDWSLETDLILTKEEMEQCLNGTPEYPELDCLNLD